MPQLSLQDIIFRKGEMQSLLSLPFCCHRCIFPLLCPHFTPRWQNEYNRTDMDDLTKEFIISFFDKNLMLHGDRPEAVRWSGPGQQLHYEILLEIGDLHRKKVLDYGCGKGDLYAFLMERGISVDYTGYDINANLISLAQKKFPEARFRVFDIDSDSMEEDFDYILLCGVFNLRVAGMDAMIRTTLKELFSHCRLGIAYNALSVHNPKKDIELQYVSPEEITQFAARELSPHIRLLQDKIPHDFTLFVYRMQMS